ncbi:hypothetical protein O181_035740 [Austropuccinia psidii MF-1]|uniref:Uncharacterized protein n=1 Tax=Austropuccinia psidii MF-1 TaxID=1389203 RepID=A0A9Q3D7G6_9BASI|nr:hypothetical protein [Austropuccinia psidii MF-1]
MLVSFTLFCHIASQSKQTCGLRFKIYDSPIDSKGNNVRCENPNGNLYKCLLGSCHAHNTTIDKGLFFTDCITKHQDPVPIVWPTDFIANVGLKRIVVRRTRKTNHASNRGEKPHIEFIVCFWDTNKQNLVRPNCDICDPDW